MVAVGTIVLNYSLYTEASVGSFLSFKLLNVLAYIIRPVHLHSGLAGRCWVLKATSVRSRTEKLKALPLS